MKLPMMLLLPVLFAGGRMATREKIKEVIKDIIVKNSGNISCLYPGLSNALVELCLSITDEILGFEDSQGVVIKVERELPDIRFSPSAIKVYDRNNKPISHADAASYTQQDMLDAGYMATEPLIKEEKDSF